MQEICRKYARKHAKYVECAGNMYEICIEYVGNMQTICNNYAQIYARKVTNMSYIQINMQVICNKKCRKYVKI
jgi:hypothetical protein